MGSADLNRGTGAEVSLPHHTLPCTIYTGRNLPYLCRMTQGYTGFDEQFVSWAPTNTAQSRQTRAVYCDLVQPWADRDFGGLGDALDPI
jgi:hypothetical protein